MGQTCEEQCESRKFGQGCQENCECQNGALCNPVDGSCNCTHGFKGLR